MKKYKKFIASLLVSGALALCFTACGGGGGGGGGGDGETSTDNNSSGNSSSSTTSLPSSLAGMTMLCSTSSGVNQYSFSSSTSVSVKHTGETDYGASVTRGSGTYSYNATTKKFNISYKVGPNKEYSYSFTGTLGNVKKSILNNTYSATWSYSMTCIVSPTTVGGVTLPGNKWSDSGSYSVTLSDTF